MRQRIIAVASTMSGFAVMAVVVSLQRHPLLWTRPTAPVSSATSAAAAPSANRSPEEPRPHAAPLGIVTLPPVLITVPKPSNVPETKVESNTLAPCSEWRELGPTYVEEGKPLGARRVRNLC